MISGYLRLIRPHQYVKNLFIFMPIFFAEQIGQPEYFIRCFLAFIAFSISASAVYILNDYQDIEADRQHPSKKNRPLASGVIPKNHGLILMVLLAFIGLGLMAYLSLNAIAILIAYVVMNIGYSFWFKHIAILDVTIIAIGFILRIYVGSAVTGVPLSHWIIIMTFLLALFLALAKRRDDVMIYLETNQRMRKVVRHYNLKFIEGAMMIMASVTIVAYIMYTTSSEVVERLESDQIYLTAFYVILGILRYLQISLVENDSGAPTRVLIRDVFLHLTLAGWLVHFAMLLYF